ncbi:MAG: GTPase domain-containing protein [Anaerolineae bacterium]|nr:GTPase domain-containing protein [Phycisphaerae bacterium]
MQTDIQQLVVDTIELTGVTAPKLLDADAPVLAPAPSNAPVSLYLVGLIGGKDVGKSSLVNALVGQTISAQSSFGEGTQSVIAYAHESAERELRSLLSREVPDRFSIITHRIDSLRRQVLLDLPDIDSHYTSHVQITRRMLRHMLFPLWIQSVEKYADQQPQALLAQVAEGNDPANFVFVLNKADQLVAREGQSAAEELRDDYARRIAGALKLSHSPVVHLISATHPQAFDLPKLRKALWDDRPATSVAASRGLADQRRYDTLIDWLDSQNLAARAARSTRLLRDAEELTAGRLAVPLLEEFLPQLTGDPSHRLAMIEPVMSKRLSRWPIVNVIQTSLSPLMALIRKNLSATPTPMDSHAPTVGGRPLKTLVQTTFAQIRQTDPTIAELYGERKLWDDFPADMAANDLSHRINGAIARQREEAMRRIATSGPFSIIAAPLRWLLTIGALLWFPIIQPILQRVLAGQFVPSWREIASVIVPLLGATYLLHSAAFLVIWFGALWMVLRWDTHRRVNRLIARWTSADLDSDLSLSGQVVSWIDDLLEPLKRRERESTQLADRLAKAKQLTS